MASLRIDRVVLRLVRIPLREPFRISNGEVSEKESIVIELFAPNVVGFGEASPMSGSFYSSDTPATAWEALECDLAPDILSRTIANPVEYAELLNGYKGEPFARAGMEGAVWHLFASHLGITISELLGAPMVPVPSGLAVGIYDSTRDLLERIELYLKDGYQRVKLKIMPGWDIEPLTAVRDRFGTIPLMVDANAAYSLAEHAPILRSLDNFDLMMIEQPLAPQALEDMATLSKMIKTPICVDESADSIDSLNGIIRCEAASIVNIKVQRVGGLWNAKKMHDRAMEAGLTCWLGTMPELGIASAQALQIAGLPGFVYPTDIEASSRWFADDLIDPPITISEDGIIRIPNVGAMGFSINHDTLEKYTVHITEFQRP